MDIRRATYNDIPVLSKLLLEVLTLHQKGRPDVFKPGCTKYTEDELKSLISDENTPIFVAENATRVLGYAFCIIKETKNDNILCDMKTLYIDDLCIDGDARGKGVGRALYEHVKEYARELKCYNVTLNVWECNEGARRFYEKMGLVPQKTIMEEII